MRLHYCLTILLVIFWALFSLSGFAEDPLPTQIKTTSTTRRPIALELVDSDKTLLAANRDSGTVSVIDVATRKILVEEKVAKRLSHFATTPDGKVAVATDPVTAELIVLAWKAGRLRETRKIKTNTRPVLVQINHNGSIATVACLWPRQVMVFHLETGKAITIDLPFAPRNQLLLSAKSKLIVTDSFGGNLAVINLPSGKIESIRKIPAHNIRGLAQGIETKTLLLTHQILYSQGRPTRGDIRSGNLFENHVRGLSLENVLNPTGYLSQGQLLYSVGDVREGAGDPTELVELAEGKLLVAFSGVNEVAIGQPKRALWTRLPVGNRPTALAVDSPKEIAFVANTFSDSISVIDLRKAEVVAEIPLGPQPELRPQDRGEMLFYDARLSFQGWYSCHSCHTDGHTNGRLNDNFTDGSFGTPKRVLSLLGVKDTPHWAWNGQVKDLRKQVHGSLTGTMQGKPPTPGQIKDLVAYLQTLPPPPGLEKTRGTINPSLAMLGAKIFKERGCVRCHKEPAFTTPKTYNVGLRDEAGETHFNPPSLRGVSQRNRFFHDNRAHSLAEVFTKFHHRVPKDFSAKELEALLHYLNTL